MNWLLAGQASKLTLSYQNRPVYSVHPDGTNRVDARNSAVEMQYQLFFN